MAPKSEDVLFQLFLKMNFLDRRIKIRGFFFFYNAQIRLTKY